MRPGFAGDDGAALGDLNANTLWYDDNFHPCRRRHNVRSKLYRGVVVNSNEAGLGPGLRCI